MKKLLSLMGGAMLLVTVHAQTQTVKPFFIGDRVPDLPLNSIVNYKDSTAKLSSFGEKLIILDFWNIHCGSCIEKFPFEDSLQKVYGDKLQFILITLDPIEKVLPFLKKWEDTHNTKFSIPIICKNSVLCTLFRHHGIPHYAWLSPTGFLLGQTTGIEFINTPIIKRIVYPVLNSIKKMRRDNFSEETLHFEQPSQVLIDAINLNQLINK